jgi:hypothetical protein
MTRRQRFWLSVPLLCVGLWAASQWWEKGLAKPVGAPHISPNGCYRVQEFQPFWVLPGFLHPMSFPDPEAGVHQFPRWEIPAFFRLYDHRNGQLIGESEIYDLVNAGGPIDWGLREMPKVSAAMIDIGPNLPDCFGDEPNPASQR